MTTESVTPNIGHLELPVEESLRRARPTPPHEQVLTEDLDDEEGAAFLSALQE